MPLIVYCYVSLCRDAILICSLSLLVLASLSPADTLTNTLCERVFRRNRLGVFMGRCRFTRQIKFHSIPESLSLQKQDLSRPANICVSQEAFLKFMGHWSCCILYHLNIHISSLYFDHIPSPCLLSPSSVPGPPVPCECLFYLLLSMSQKHLGGQF